MRTWVVGWMMLWAVGCVEPTAAVSAPAAPAVHAHRIEPRTITPTSSATADILAHRQATLRAETAGRVTEVGVEVGQVVSLGDVLIKLDVSRATSAVKAAQAGATEARARLAQAKREQKRVERLVKAGGLPRQQLDEAHDAVEVASAAKDAADAEARLRRRGLSEARIRSPFEGTVVERVAEVGEYVSPGAPLVTVADVSKLKARVLLDPRETLDVAKDARVFVTVHARPNQTFQAKVLRVGRVIDPRTRRLPVEIEFLDATEKLRPGLTARFEVETGAPRQALLLPRRAVFERFGAQHVYVLTDDHIAKRVPVELASAQDNQIEVASGIHAGDLVVTEGVSRVVDGSPVRVVEPDRDPPKTQARREPNGDPSTTKSDQEPDRDPSTAKARR